jgi:uncharacterized protein YqeY
MSITLQSRILNDAQEALKARNEPKRKALSYLGAQIKTTLVTLPTQ